SATDLDRWAGPRARPNWLRRLLSSFLGGSSPAPAASDLVHQMNADGDLNIGELTIEKIKLTNVHAEGSLHDLRLEVRDADAQWAGGAVHAQMNAVFAPVPKYDVTAKLDGVNLAKVPGPSRFAEHLAGLASGTVQLVTSGVGRDQLLQSLAGGGDVQFSNVVVPSWDVNASVASGAPRSGTSRWTIGDGTFTMRNRGVFVDHLTLESVREQTSLHGTVSFAGEMDLTIETLAAGKRLGRAIGVNDSGPVLKISGPLDALRFSVQKAAARQPAD
ncbi:MAG: AsmA-like C-terminal region-containing protein, partial [Candidatus Acidiferrum sp.]